VRLYLIPLPPFANDFRSEKAGLCLNVYDVRLKDKIPACGLNWPTDLTNITSYLRVRSLSQHYDLHYSPTQTATRCFGCFPRAGQIRGMG
jgi:carboxypeptidase C (cathepsin A)